ncbi:MAG: hypothetical protein Q9183_000432, partial [Haloplaca sp. 2 TL-2023]
IASLQDTVDGDPDMLDGYDGLPLTYQDKVMRALQQGHVDDEDWKGDKEMNRPGMKGFRSAATKKQRKAEAKQAAEAAENAKDEATKVDGSTDNVDEAAKDVNKTAENVDGKDNPSQSAPPKRGHAEKDDLADEEVKEPARKKTKATAKKPAKARGEIKEESIQEPEDGDPATRPNKAAESKGARSKAAGKETTATKTSKEKPKASAKKPKKEVEESLTNGTDTAAVPEPIMTSGNKSKGSGARNAKEATAVEARQTRSSARSRKTNVDYAENEELSSEHDEQSAKAAPKSQAIKKATKNAAKTKKVISKKANEAPLEEDVETCVEEAPRAKKGSKRAAASKKTKV